MKASVQCAVCGTELLQETPEGLCPKCMLARGLELLVTPEPTLSNLPTDAAGVRTPFTGTTFRYFGDYEVLEEIATGGMGVVFKARQASLNRLVALKLISAGALATEALVKRFKAEAEAAASLSHPNIVPIHEIGERHGQHYFSMGLIVGPNLREHLRSRPLPTRQSAQLIAILARAVHHAHQHGVLHRDIKPGNVLIDGDGSPHLTDFGLAKLVQKDSTLTHTNAILGTPAYMAPEQARGDIKSVTTAADIYGLGAVLYECLTGQPPFAGGTSFETIRQVLEKEPRPPSELNSAVDRDVQTICLKCLEKEPARRYPSALSLAEDLERWLRNEPIEARSSTTFERLQKWVRRRPAIAGLSASLVVALLAGFVLVFWQWRLQLRATERAERDQYRTKIMAADNFGADRTKHRMREILLSCPERFRHWEWGYLLGRSELATRSFRAQSSAVKAMAFSRDGFRLASGDQDGNVRLHYLGVGKEIISARTHGPIISVALNSRHQHLVAVSADGSASVWNSDTAVLVRKIEPTSGITGSSLSRDGRWLAVCAKNQLIVWNTETGQKVKPSTPYPANALRAVFDFSGDRIAISLPNSVIVCETETGRVLSTLARELDYLSFTPDGRSIVGGRSSSASGGELALFNLETGVGHTTGTSADSVLVGPNGKYFVTRSSDFSVRLWDLETMKEIRRRSPDAAEIYPQAFSPDGKWVASAMSNGNVELWSLELWRVDTGSVALPITGVVSSLAAASDGTFPDGAAAIWDVRNSAELKRLSAHKGTLTDTAFSSDSRYFATAGDDGVVKLWDAASGEERHASQAHNGPVKSIVFHPDGRQLISGGPDGSLTSWDFASGNSRTLGRTKNSISKIALRADGQQVLVGSLQGITELIDFKTGQIELTLSQEAQSARVSAVSFDPSGRSIAIGSANGTIQLCNASSGRQLLRLQTHAVPIAVFFTPDSQRLFTVSSYEHPEPGQSRIEIWDTADGAPLLAIPASGKISFAAALTTDARKLFVAHDSPSIQVWEPLPWRNRDFPGDDRMPLEQRIDQYIRFSWDPPTAAGSSQAASRMQP